MMVVSDARNSTTAGIAYGYIQLDRDAGQREARRRARRRGARPRALEQSRITRYTIVPGLIPCSRSFRCCCLPVSPVSRGARTALVRHDAHDARRQHRDPDPARPSCRPLIACGQAFLIFVIGFLWFELPFEGSFLLLGLVIFGFSLCMVGLGLGVSAVADNIQQSIVMIIVMMLPMVILSGLMTSSARHAPLDADRYDPQSRFATASRPSRRLLRGRGPREHPAARLARRSRGARLDEPRNLSLQAQDLVICAEDKKL